MSTRAVIAFPDDSKPDGFYGVYHHWDGYPSGLGAELWRLYHGVYYDGDLRKMRHDLLDRVEARSGWSTIQDHDETAAPSWEGVGWSSYYVRAANGLEHGGEDAADMRYDSLVDVADSWAEWFYLLSPEGLTVWPVPTLRPDPAPEWLGDRGVAPADLPGNYDDGRESFPWGGDEPDWKNVGRDGEDDE